MKSKYFIVNKEKLWDALFAGFVIFFIVAAAGALVFGAKLAANPPPAAERKVQCTNIQTTDPEGVVIVCYQVGEKP